MARPRKNKDSSPTKERVCPGGIVLRAVLEYVIEETAYQASPPRSDKERLEGALHAIFGKKDGRPQKDDSVYLLHMHEIILRDGVSPNKAAAQVVHSLKLNGANRKKRGESTDTNMQKRLAKSYNQSPLRGKKVMPTPQAADESLRDEWEAWAEKEDAEKRKAVSRFMQKYWP